MDNEKLLEIRNALATLPILQERMEKLCKRIKEAESEVSSLLHKYESESRDVERMKKESLSATILRLIGKYESKLDKEVQEQIKAKMEYDKACDRVKELYAERDELRSRIDALNRDKRIYEAELRRREQEIQKDTNSNIYKEYRRLEEEAAMLRRQLAETDEAIRAAQRVRSTAESAMRHLESAEGWATYDVWAKGGFLSHMAKYNHIDNAEYEFNRLHSQLRDLHKELSDVNFSGTVELKGIDSLTRTVDFWFDNIFTDLSVRSRIRENIEELRSLTGKIANIIYRLERNKSGIYIQIKENESKKNDLIIMG
ncbi:MAG TPA: hypothetical protein GXX36_02140 [Clostridiaceae bacterium]|nr:hypothetical protein [Clostridiaceae bacterium]